MNIELCFLLNVVLVSRLLFTFHDRPVNKKQVVVMTVIQCAGLLAYALQWIDLLPVVFFALSNAIFYGFEHKTQKTNETRLLLLLIDAVFLSVMFSPWVNLRFNPQLLDFFKNLGQYSVLFSMPVDWGKLNIYLFGALLVTNETNILIRYIFNRFDLSPTRPSDSAVKLIKGIDRREYNAGRIIGILERVIIYFFILNAQYGAIGLVLAAKSFTRFKELENREFAEYVLIGTLISTLLAMLVGLLVIQATR